MNEHHIRSPSLPQNAAGAQPSIRATLPTMDLEYHRPCSGCRKYVRIGVTRNHEYGVSHELPECSTFQEAMESGRVAEFAKGILGR